MLRNPPERRCEILSHTTTLGSRLETQQEPNRSLSALPKRIYKRGMR